MALFYPVDNQVSITDGTAAPGTPAAPVGLQNFTPNHRSGGDISVTNAAHPRGAMGRAADEHGYLRRYAVAISDMGLEQDDAATTGTNVLFDMADARTANQRVYQRQYRSGHTRTVGALVTGVADAYSDTDVLMMNVTLQATGTISEVGFALALAFIPFLGLLA